MMNSENIAYIGLGANLGNAQSNVQAALESLKNHGNIELLAQSDFFRSAPWQAAGPDFINAVAKINTTLAPLQLLGELARIENELGRIRSYRNAPRLLDLDILLYADLQMSSELLSIPHPRMTERAFVMIPLLQIEPDLVVPGKGVLQDYLEQVKAQSIFLIEKT